MIKKIVSSKRPQNILFFADKLWPNVGGVETHAEYFIKYFQENGDFPLVGVITFDDDKKQIIKYRNEVHPFDFDNYLLKTSSIIFYNSGRWISQMSLIRKHAPNALHVYRTGGNEILKADLPSPAPDCHRERQSRWVDTINSNIDVLVTNSVFTEERLRKLEIKIPFLRAVGGVKTSTNLIRKSNQKVIKLFCAARFVPYKNHKLLIDVIQILLNAGLPIELRLAGDGPLFSECVNLVNIYCNSSSFIFLGKISNDAVISEIQNSDYYIQFSTDVLTQVSGGSYIHTEGMGRSYLEAISSGVFVIGLNTGALAEIINPYRGILLPLDSATNIAEKLINVFKNSPPKPSPTHEYSWENIFLKYENFWKNGA